MSKMYADVRLTVWKLRLKSNPHVFHRSSAGLSTWNTLSGAVNAYNNMEQEKQEDAEFVRYHLVEDAVYDPADVPGAKEPLPFS